MERNFVLWSGRVILFVLILGFWLLAFAFLPQNAFAEKIVIRYAHQLPETQPVGKQARFFEKCVKGKSKGNIVIEVYPAAQLFGARDLLPAVRGGGVEIAAVVSPALQGAIPESELFEVPFLLQTFDSVKAVWRGYPGEVIKEGLIKNGVKLLTPGYYGFNALCNSTREIRTPKDLKGLKLGAVGPMQADLIKLFGAAPIVTGGEEAYLSMARKVTDGRITGAVSMASRKYWEVQSYLTLLPTGYMDIPMLINLKYWNGLPKEVQKLLQECADESGEFVLKESIEDEAKAVKMLQENGMKVHTPTPAEMQEFQKASAPLTEAWVTKRGEVAVKMLKFVENIK